MPSFLLIATCLTSALAVGFLPVFLANIKAPLRQHLSLPDADTRVDRLDRCLLFFWVPLLPLAGWLVDCWGLPEVLFFGQVGAGFSVSWFGARKTYGSALGGVLGLAFSGACVTTACITLMPEALRFRANWSTGAALCLGFFFVTLSFLVTPLVVPWTVNKFGFKRTLLWLGAMFAIPAVLAFLTPGDNFPAPREPQPLGESFQDIRLLLIAAVAFLYFPLERSLEVWPRPYLTEIGYDSRSIGRLLVGFWIAFLLMRFGLGWVIRTGNEAWLVLVLLVVSSMIVGNLSGAYAPNTGYIGFWLVGACYGPILPALLAIVIDIETPRGAPALAIGFFLSLGALNALIVQPLFVSYAQKRKAREAMRLPMLLGLVMAAPTLVLALIRNMR